jgi:hypothetical protein
MTRRTTNEVAQLDLSALNKAGAFSAANIRLTLDFPDEGQGIHVQVINDHTQSLLAISDGPKKLLLDLVSTRCHFGGRRWWLKCPGLEGRSCLRRVRIVYRPPGSSLWACRACQGLGYTSSQRSHEPLSHKVIRPLRQMREAIHKMEGRRYSGPRFAEAHQAYLDAHFQLQTTDLVSVI